jgi:hypothetical protein
MVADYYFSVLALARWYRRQYGWPIHTCVHFAWDDLAEERSTVAQ